MVLETENEKICINKIVGNKQDTVVVEGDAIVPDVKPDILNTISTNGTVCIYKKEVQDGKVKIEGTINTYVIYLADSQDSNVRCLNTNIDFSAVSNMEDARADMKLDTEVSLKSIECKVLNGRKVSVKAILEIKNVVMCEEEVELVKSIGDNNSIQTLNKEYTISSIVGRGEVRAYAKDTLTIDNTDELAEIMKADIRLINRDTKISYNKILVKAEAEVKLMYLTEDNRINMVRSNIPVMGFIDIQDVSEDNVCDLKCDITNMIIKPNSSEEHSIYVEIETNFMCSVYDNKTINIIEDLYCVDRNVNMTQMSINVMSPKVQYSDIFKIQEKQQIQEIVGNKIYDVNVNPIITNKRVMKDRIVFEGDIELEYIYAGSNNSKINTKILKLPLNYEMMCEGIDKDKNVDTSFNIISQDFIIVTENTVEANISIEFRVSYSERTNINILNNIETGEEEIEDTNSITIYYVKPNDTLWKIAKMFRTTVEDICAINNIEDVYNLQIGQQLYIPRYSAKKVC